MAGAILVNNPLNQLFFKLRDLGLMVWSSFLRFLCPRMVHPTPGVTRWLYNSFCYPAPARSRNSQSEAGLQDLGMGKTSYSWFHLARMVKMNCHGSFMTVDQEGCAEKCVCKCLAECISSFGKIQLKDAGEETDFNVPFFFVFRNIPEGSLK